jgi:hypothetical protein
MNFIDGFRARSPETPVRAVEGGENRDPLGIGMIHAD